MLDDKALDLGRQIGQSPEYRRSAAEGALRADQDAVTRLEKIEDGRGGLAISRGEPDEATTQQYEASVRDLEMSGRPGLRRRARTRQADGPVNHQISQGIEESRQLDHHA
jgi:hypothetical protein